MQRRSRARPTRSREQLLGALEQVLARVLRRVADHVVEERLQRAPDARPGLVADCDQIVAADGQVAQAMRARRLLLDHSPDPREPLALGLRRLLSLSAQVCLLVIEELEREPPAVPGEEP